MAFVGGGGGFSLTGKEPRGSLDYSFPACIFQYFFLSGDQLARSSSIFLRLESVHSGSESLADRGRVFPDELRVNSFP